MYHYEHLDVATLKEMAKNETGPPDDWKELALDVAQDSAREKLNLHPATHVRSQIVLTS